MRHDKLAREPEWNEWIAMLDLAEKEWELLLRGRRFDMTKEELEAVGRTVN